MATFRDIINKLEKRQFAPVYILMGEEPLYIDKISDYIEENVMEEADRDFNQVIYYAKDVEPEEVVAQAKEFPFGVEKRVVIVKEAKDWKNLTAIKNYALNPTESTILVICYKYGKWALAKDIAKVAVVFDSIKVQDYKLGPWVEQCAKDHGFAISPNSAALIAEHIGNDLSRIDNEFYKLSIILPKGSEISTDIIEKYIGISNKYNVFALRDAIVAHDEVKAYKIVNAFCQNVKSAPILQTISSLFNFYHSMLKYQLAPTKSLDEMKLCFGANKTEYQLRRDTGIAAGFSRQILIRNIAILREFDAKAKGIDNAATEEDLYKELIYKLLH